MYMNYGTKFYNRTRIGFWREHFHKNKLRYYHICQNIGKKFLVKNTEYWCDVKIFIDKSQTSLLKSTSCDNTDRMAADIVIKSTKKAIILFFKKKCYTKNRCSVSGLLYIVSAWKLYLATAYIDRATYC